MKRFKPELEVLIKKIKEYQQFEDTFTGDEELPDLNLGSLFSAIDDTTRTLKSAIFDYEKEQTIKHRGALLNFWVQQEDDLEHIVNTVCRFHNDSSPDTIDNLDDEEMEVHCEVLEDNLSYLKNYFTELEMKFEEFKLTNQ